MNEVKKLGYKRWLIYKQPRQDLDLCGNSFVRYLEKCSTQIYRALYGDAMFTSNVKCLEGLEGPAYDQTRTPQGLIFFGFGKWWRHMKTKNSLNPRLCEKARMM